MKGENVMNDINMPELNGSQHSGQPVRALQYMLDQLAIYDSVLRRLAVDGMFGEETLEAVMVFQREHQIPVNGVVDLGTWDAIRAAYFESELLHGAPPPLNVLPDGAYTATEGEEGPPVSIALAMFTSLGKKVSNFHPCEAAGRNDGALCENFREIQRLGALPVTGTLDRATWAYLVQLYQALVTRE